MTLFSKSFGFLQSLRLTEEDIRKIFRWIDQDRDGIISYKEYLQWTLELLKFREANGTPCYFQATPLPAPVPVEKPAPQSVIIDKAGTRWVFTSRVLAENALQQALRILLGFDANNNKFADPEEIVEILKALLRENQHEIDYVLVNYFRYTKGGPVSFEEFAKFFLGLHCGELAVQRLHREGFYSRGKELSMNEAEFIRTLTQALITIKFTANESDVRQLFRDIDVNRRSWITYQSYFEALKEFFGYRLQSNILIYIRSTITTVSDDQPKPLPKPVPEPPRPIQDELGALIRSMTLLLLSHYDFNHNFEFERDEIIAILRDIFNESGTEIDYVILNMFRYDPNGDKSVTYDELTNFILEMHCGEIALQRLHREKKFAQWQKRLLSLEDFILVFRVAFAFLKYNFKTEDLTSIFRFIDTDRDGFISYSEYFTFIRNYLGSKRQTNIPVEVPNIPSVKRFNSIEEEVGDNIRTRTIELLSRYDINKDLQFQKSEIIELLKEVFGESKIEIDYVILNISRYDSNNDGEVTYDELANFILDQHCGEITLQRLHKVKKLSKWEQRVMNLDEFSLLMRESFSFVNLQFKDNDLKEIFGRLDEDKDGWIPYGRYFQFIREYMGSKRG